MSIQRSPSDSEVEALDDATSQSLRHRLSQHWRTFRSLGQLPLVMLIYFPRAALSFFTARTAPPPASIFTAAAPHISAPTGQSSRRRRRRHRRRRPPPPLSEHASRPLAPSHLRACATLRLG